MSDDGRLDDRFGVPAGPAAEEGPAPERRRSPVPRVIGEVALIGLTTVVVVAALRAGGVRIPLLLIVAALLALRLVLWAASAVAPPPAPNPRSRSGPDDPAAADALRAAVSRWEGNLERAQSDPDRRARNVLPVLAELTDERLRLQHGITRATDPQRARELLGEELWSALADSGRRGLKARDVETFVNVLERL